MVPRAVVVPLRGRPEPRTVPGSFFGLTRIRAFEDLLQVEAKTKVAPQLSQAAWILLVAAAKSVCSVSRGARLEGGSEVGL
jgi:hypothetical protein